MIIIKYRRAIFGDFVEIIRQSGDKRTLELFIYHYGIING